MYEPIQLKHLDLSYNQIHSLQKDLFEHTPYLEVLILEGNQLRVIDQVTQLAVSTLNNLQVNISHYHSFTTKLNFNLLGF